METGEHTCICMSSVVVVVVGVVVGVECPESPPLGATR